MNKTELVAAMAKETNLSKKDVEAVLKSFIDVVSEELKKGEKVQLVGFGTFEVSERAAREGRNPQTGETMKIEASKAPKFKADKFLKVSRLIKRRTVANEACDAGRVLVNDKPAKASAQVKTGDTIEIQFGSRNVKVEVLDVKETVKKEEVENLYRYV